MKPQNAVRRPALAAGLAVIAFALAACGGTTAAKGSGGVPPNATQPNGDTTTAPTDSTTTTSAPRATVPAPTTTTTTAPSVTTVSVTGSGTAQSITILVGSSKSQYNDVPLPYNATLPDNSQIVGVQAQTDDGSTSATISCSLTSPGSAAVSSTSSGSYAVVNCSGHG